MKSKPTKPRSKTTKPKTTRKVGGKPKSRPTISAPFDFKVVKSMTTAPPKLPKITRLEPISGTFVSKADKMRFYK